MKQIIFIHGGGCYPDNDTFCKAIETRDYNPFEEKKRRKDWLVIETEGDYQMIKPDMPNKGMASYKVWKTWFEKILPYLNDEELIVIGHSLGAMFLIKYLGENIFPKKIKQLHLVSGVFDDSDMPEEEKYLGDFIYEPKIISNLQDKAEDIFIYHSKDDKVVPYSHGEKIKSYLPKAKFRTFTDRGHINQPEFPELLANIRK